ncbi:MAG: hypothetical protein BWZ04_02768 [Firmicutes bacterium ADurb.BinA205]|nr:MAG: hypothetical protein BWZ04_02768 [Firmicutes bacterium ADurb.BinA205]
MQTEPMIPSVPIAPSTSDANFMPNTECTPARISGTMKNIPVCLNRDEFIAFSPAPIFLSISYLSELSVQSERCFSARIAAQEMRKISPM